MTEHPAPPARAGENAPAMVFHPSEMIREECVARGWTLDELVRRGMRLGDDYRIASLAMGIYLVIGPDEPDVRLGNDGAQDLERALGISAEFWLSMERQWLANPLARNRLLVPYDPDDPTTFAKYPDDLP